jgi:uncharacterized membrane protein
MDLTIFLAKLLGLGCLIIGAALAVRRNYFVTVLGTLVDQHMTRMAIAIVELFAGLALILAHSVWSTVPAALVSLIGWLALLEASIYLLLPDGAIRKILAGFNSPAGLVAIGVPTAALGAYLAGFGFGWW